MGTLRKQPLLVFVPEIPAIPARPAYCNTQQVFAGYAGGSGSKLESGGGSSRSTSNGVPYLDANGNVSYQGLINGGGSVGAGSGRRPIYKNVTTCYPAVAGVPGTPGRIDQASSIGWNAGARSVQALPTDGFFQCRIPVSPSGVIVGLSDGRYVHSYGHASHALVVRKTGMAPLSRGKELAEPVPLAPGALVRFERSNGTVRLFVDGDLFYTFAEPARGQLFADVTLYGLSDFVSEPKIGGLGAWVEGVIPTPQGVLGVGSRSGIDGRMPLFTLEALGRLVEGVQGMAPALVGVLGESGYSRVSGRVPAMTLTARAGVPEAVESGVLGYVPPMELFALSLTGGVGGVDGTIPTPNGKASEGAYAFVDSVWGGSYKLTAWAPYLPDNVHDGGDVIFAADFGGLDNVVMFIVHDGIQISDHVDLVLLINLEAYEYMGVGDHATLGGVIQLLAMERVAINSSARAARQEALQYAVNVMTGALTTYQNFGFTQFARVGGETYAIRPDGLYCLRGDTDNGETLRALIDFGASDYGTAQGKRVAHIYAGVTTDGEVYVRVTPDDGAERCYRAVGDSPEFRAPVAKGLKARHWRVRLELTDATYADVDNIEVELGVSQRRLSRGRR